MFWTSTFEFVDFVTDERGGLLIRLATMFYGFNAYNITSQNIEDAITSDTQFIYLFQIMMQRFAHYKLEILSEPLHFLNYAPSDGAI